MRRRVDDKEFAAKTMLRSRCKHWQQAMSEVDHWSELSSPYHPAILQLIGHRGGIFGDVVISVISGLERL